MTRKYSIAERMLWLALAAGLPFFAFVGTRELDAHFSRNAAAFLTSGRVEETPFALPYFSRIGARLLGALGPTENAARLSSALPAFAAVFVLLLWVWRRMGWETAVASVFLLACTPWASSFGAVGPEAFYSLAAVLVAIAAFERYWRAQIGIPKRIGWNLAILGGFALGSSMLGLFGFSLCFGALGSLLLAFLLSERSFARLLLSLVTSPLGFAAALCFPLVHAWKLVSGNELPEVAANAFRDATTSSHSSYFTGEWNFSDWHPFSPLIVFAVENAVWLWALPCAWVLLFATKTRREELPSKALAWSANAASFVFAAALFASFKERDEARLMLRALIPLLAPLGGLFFSVLVLRLPVLRRKLRPSIRWASLAAAFALAGGLRGVREPSRLVSRAFMSVSSRLNRLPESCELWLPEGTLNEEEMDSYGAWYFKNRAWFFSKNRIPSAIALPEGRVFWNPDTGELLGRKECEP